MTQTIPTDSNDPMLDGIEELLPRVVQKSPTEAVRMLEPFPPEFVVSMLELLNPSVAQDVFARFPSERRPKIMMAATPPTRRQWMCNEACPEQTVGQMMEPPLAVYLPGTTSKEATTTFAT